MLTVSRKPNTNDSPAQLADAIRRLEKLEPSRTSEAAINELEERLAHHGQELDPSSRRRRRLAPGEDGWNEG